MKKYFLLLVLLNVKMSFGKNSTLFLPVSLDRIFKIASTIKVCLYKTGTLYTKTEPFADNFFFRYYGHGVLL
jgi:hypothetical protein